MSNVGYATLTVIPSARGFASALRGEMGGMGAIGAAAGDDAGRSFSSRFGGALSSLGVVAAKAAAGLAAGGAVAAGFGLKIAASNEQALISFETMLGSAEKAGSFLKELQAFAAKTPFEFPELQTAATSLISAGFEANKVIPIMTTLGNVTSGMGTGSEGVKRATVALQQMSAAGRITGEDLNQLRDAGIPVFDLLAGATGKSKEEISALAQAGKLGKTEMDQLFKALETGGAGLERFDGLMEKQSKSLTGMVSTLKDTVGQGLATMMQPAVEGIKNALPQMTAAIDSMIKSAGPALTGLFGGLVNTVSAILPAIAPILGQVAALFAHAFAIVGPVLKDLTPVIAEVAATLGTALHGLGPLADAFGELVAAVSPLLPPLAELAGTVLTALVRGATPMVEAFTEMATSMVGTADSAGPLVKIVNALAGVINALPTPVLTAMLTAFLAWKTAIQPATQLVKSVRDVGGAVGYAAARFPTLTSAFSTMGKGMSGAVSGLGSVAAALGRATAAGARAAAAFVASAARSVAAFALTAASAVASAAAVVAAWLVAAAPFIALGLVIAGVVAAVVIHWDTIKAATAAAWDAIVGVVRAVGAAVVALISGYINLIKGYWNFWATLASTVIGAMGAVAGAVRDGVGAVVGFVAELPGKITRAIGDLGRTLLNAGKALMRGLLNGIKEGFKSVAGWVGGIGGKIADLKGPLDYDKRLLIPAGVAIMGGLRKGIVSQMPALASDLAQVTRTIEGLSPVGRGSVALAPVGGVALAPAASQRPLVVQLVDRDGRMLSQTVVKGQRSLRRSMS